MWHAATTTNADRKQLIAFLIKDVCLTRAETTIEVSIRWQTEACTVLSVPRPRAPATRGGPTPPSSPVRALAADTPDGRIAEILDREGFRSGTGPPVHDKHRQAAQI